MAPGDGSDLVEAEASGTFNAPGPVSPLTMAETLYGIRAVTASEVDFTLVAADFLREHEVGAWMEMSLWGLARTGGVADGLIARLA